MAMVKVLDASGSVLASSYGTSLHQHARIALRETTPQPTTPTDAERLAALQASVRTLADRLSGVGDIYTVQEMRAMIGEPDDGPAIADGGT